MIDNPATPPPKTSIQFYVLDGNAVYSHIQEVIRPGRLSLGVYNPHFPEQLRPAHHINL